MNQDTIKSRQYDAGLQKVAINHLSSQEEFKITPSFRNKPLVVAAIADSEDENRFEALFDRKNNNDRTGKFSLTRYSDYTKK